MKLVMIQEMIQAELAFNDAYGQLQLQLSLLRVGDAPGNKAMNASTRIKREIIFVFAAAKSFKKKGP